MSRKTGDSQGAAGVKTAKLCAEQDQIGRQKSAASAKSSGRLHKGDSNIALRGMTALRAKRHLLLVRQNPAYRISVEMSHCGTG